MKYYIGLDIGTSAVKGALMDEDGTVVRVTDKKFSAFLICTNTRMEPSHGF